MDAPIKPKVRVTYPTLSSVKRRLDFDSTNATIHAQEDDGEPEVTSRYRSVSESSTFSFSKKKLKKDLLWEHLVRLVVARND